MKQDTGTRCRRWLHGRAGFHGEVRCGLPYGHEGDHDDIDALAAKLTNVLASPGLPQHAVRALNSAIGRRAAWALGNASNARTAR